jgi:hypothetical protein
MQLTFMALLAIFMFSTLSADVASWQRAIFTWTPRTTDQQHGQMAASLISVVLEVLPKHRLLACFASGVGVIFGGAAEANVLTRQRMRIRRGPVRKLRAAKPKAAPMPATVMICPAVISCRQPQISIDSIPSDWVEILHFPMTKRHENGCHSCQKQKQHTSCPRSPGSVRELRKLTLIGIRSELDHSAPCRSQALVKITSGFAEDFAEI